MGNKYAANAMLHGHTLLIAHHANVDSCQILPKKFSNYESAQKYIFIDLERLQWFWHAETIYWYLKFGSIFRTTNCGGVKM